MKMKKPIKPVRQSLKKIMPKVMENYNPKIRNNRAIIIYDYRS